MTYRFPSLPPMAPNQAAIWAIIQVHAQRLGRLHTFDFASWLHGIDDLTPVREQVQEFLDHFDPKTAGYVLSQPNSSVTIW